MIFGSKFSGKKVEEDPEENVKINRSLKIDCSGPTRIIDNPSILNQ